MADPNLAASAGQKDSQSAVSASGIGRVVELPKPTPDQLEYLNKVRETESKYDPSTIVGGPRRNQP